MALTGTNRVGDIGRDVIVGMEAKKKPARRNKKAADNVSAVIRAGGDP